jgi:long-chain acyl-CoA synthetase
MDKEAMIQNFKNQLETLNPILKSYERIHRVILLKEPWTVENNKLTPTLKLKRAIIEKEFHTRIEPWYESKDVVVFEV